MRFFIELAYKGTNYHGWQIQPNAKTVQEEVNKVLSTILNVNIEVIGAGRTDAGVHARQMFAHFNASINRGFFKELVYLLNSYLPKSINILSIERVKTTAHARFDAVERTYKYYISTIKDPFNNSYHYFIKNPPDIDLMNEASKIIIGCKDFKSFSKSHSDVKTFICEIKNAFWYQKDNQLIFSITSNRFLRNMVRSIVGTLLEIGFKKTTFEDLKKIIKSRDRSRAGFSVPANGLFLTKIVYPSNIYIRQ